MWTCGDEIETPEYFFLRFRFYSTQRSEHFDTLEKTKSDFKHLSDKDQFSFMLYS